MMTPYYQDDLVTIYRGDCRDVGLPTADMVLTDPPYGEVNRPTQGLRILDKGVADIETMSPSMVVELIGGLAPSHYVWCGTEQVSELRAGFVRKGFSTRLGIWEKSNPSPMNGQYLWLSAIETCVFARTKGAYFSRFCESPVWRGASVHHTKTLHPTQKPEWLFKYLIESSCPPNGLVIDPFMGVGTALVCAKQSGRRAIGVDIEEKYCAAAVERIKATK